MTLGESTTADSSPAADLVVWRRQVVCLAPEVAGGLLLVALAVAAGDSAAGLAAVDSRLVVALREGPPTVLEVRVALAAIAAGCQAVQCLALG